MVIYGDGEQTRDFVNAQDVAKANYLAGTSADASGSFNIGSGTRITINELARVMFEIFGRDQQVLYEGPRPGDVRDSLAAIDAARDAFGFDPKMPIEEGIRLYAEWLKADPITLSRVSS